MKGDGLEITIVGAAVILIAFTGMLTGRLAGAVLLGVTVPLSASAALILGWAGGATILCSVVAAGALIARAGLEGAACALSRARFGISGAGAFLTAFTALAILGGYALPRLFEGQTEIYAMDRTVIGVTEGVMRFPLTMLKPHAGNITQSILLTASVALFFAVASLTRRDARLPTTILWAATASQAIFALMDLTGAGILDYFRTATYAIAPNQAFAGFTRLIGGATEPAFFGGVATALCVWHLWRHRILGGAPHAVAAAGMAVMSVASLSSTAIAVLAAAIGLYLAQRLAASRSLAAFAGAFFLAAAMIAGAAWALLGPLADLLATGADGLFLRKLSSESGIERSAWAAQALTNFQDTHGLGAGLGASRTSGWAMAVLGQTGAPGAILIVGFLVLTFARPLPNSAAPLRAACLALLAAAMLSASRIDLGPLFFALAGSVVALTPRPAPRFNPNRQIYAPDPV